ncbi:MAG: transcription antitermination factor NusB [Pseudanabaenaceae cyanobacterium bins.68]|nr:transcription antitermination factor NusB [Pseudanabaenaceae cyanobacterium bins.68]
MQVRRIARELALLSMGQLPTKSEKLAAKDYQELILAAVRSLLEETQEMLQDASAELKRASDKLLDSETKLDDPRTRLKSSQTSTGEAIALVESAINRAGLAIEFPELIQVAKQEEVREYAVTLLTHCHEQKQMINERLSAALVDWQLERLASMDRQILQLAVVELVYLHLPTQIAINEAVELAKRYSSEDGYRFVNGVLKVVAKAI